MSDLRCGQIPCICGAVGCRPPTIIAPEHVDRWARFAAASTALHAAYLISLNQGFPDDKTAAIWAADYADAMLTEMLKRMPGATAKPVIGKSLGQRTFEKLQKEEIARGGVSLVTWRDLSKQQQERWENIATTEREERMSDIEHDENYQ